MRELDIRVTAFTQISRKYSSYEGNTGKVAPNLVSRRFDSSIPHQKMTTDTTKFKYHETDISGNIQIKKIYLDLFLDIFNREIMNFRLSKQPNGQTITSALEKAVEATDDCKFRRTFHSDQG
jgi:putative transposase